MPRSLPFQGAKPRTTIVQSLPGINGIGAGASCNFTLPVNLRLFGVQLQVQAVNYTGGTNLTATKVTSASGAALKVDVTVNAATGLVTAIIPHSGSAGTGWVTGDTMTFTDETGSGFVGTVTASSGAVTAIAITTAGVATPMDPAVFFTNVSEYVNNVTMRNLNGKYRRMIRQANGINDRLGTLVIPYAEEQRNFLRHRYANTWDLFGQNNFQCIMQIAPGLLLPNISGIYEFDYGRNTISPDGGKTVLPYLEPIAYKTISVSLAAGDTKISTQFPFDYPVLRAWVLGASPGNIYKSLVQIDGVQYLQSVNPSEAAFAANTFGVQQAVEMYEAYGFQFGRANYNNQNQTSQNTLGINPITYFDTALIADYRNNYEEGVYGKTFEWTISSLVAQNADIVIEFCPGAYQA